MTEPREMPEGLEARLEREWRSLVESIAEAGRSPLDLPPDRRMAISRVALLAQLEEVREEWKRLRELVDEETGARFANATWTVKDLLAHLASWAREFRGQIEAVSRRESFDYAIPFAMSVLGPNEWNEKEVAARRVLRLERIFEEFEEETRRLGDVVIAMDDRSLYRPTAFPLAPTGNPDERLQLPPGFLVAGKCLHDLHHFAQLRELLIRFRK
ncbi:MAG: maleylpyruvate isomerase N-terminal domain-containing protein [Vicinamibacteria bacterium]